MAKKKYYIDLTELRKLSAIQCTESEAAAFFGCSLKKFKEILQQLPEVKQAWEQGKEQGKISLRRKQFRLADSSAPMAIHLGAQILGQVPKSKLEHSGPNGGPIETKEELDLNQLSQSERNELRKILTRASQSKPTT